MDSKTSKLAAAAASLKPTPKAPEQGIPIGLGITSRTEGSILRLDIALTGNFGPSSSGKTRKVASTGGNVTVAGGLKLGLNVYDPDTTRTIPADRFPETAALTLGANVNGSLRGGVLSLVIDTSQDLGPSSSGKSRLVASTNGNVTLPLGLKLGLNCYDPIPAPRS